VPLWTTGGIIDITQIQIVLLLVSSGLFLFLTRAPLLYGSDPEFEGEKRIEEAREEN
jgi:hypothetical protein